MEFWRLPRWHNRTLSRRSCARAGVDWEAAISSTIDFRKIIRSRKPEKRQTRLTARADTDLIDAAYVAGKGRQVFVPDTNIYIMDAAGTLPSAATNIIDQGMMFHCAVCLAELSAGVGKYSPRASKWKATADHYTELFDCIPSNRLLVPDPQVWVDAGMIAGIVARLQGFPKQRSKELLNDAAIYLCAARHGFPVLTENKFDFDLLQQVAPGGSFIFV